jgi:uncharacterized protein YndB with AHSA1/START domain
MFYVALALGGVILAVVLVGYALPKSHRASRTASYAAPPAVVFARIADVGRYADWRSDVARIERLPDEDGHVVFREHGKHGPILFRIEESTPPSRMRTRIADPSLPFGGTWTYELTSTATGGTELTITEDGEVSNPIFRFISRVFLSQTASIEAFQTALTRALEKR